MRKILLVDTNMAFTSDVESRLILDVIPNTDIVIANDFEGLSAIIQKERPNELMISAKMIAFHPDWDFGLPVKCYAKNAEDIQLANEHHIPCVGIIKTAKELCIAVEENRVIEVVKSQKNEEVPEPSVQTPVQDPVQPEPQEQEVSKPSSQSQEFHDPFADVAPVQPVNEPKPEPVYQKPQEPVRTMETHDIRARLAEARAREEEEERRRQAALRKQEEQDAKRTVEMAMGTIKQPARVVTVYSAKGGVGKTTISCELATFLALTSHGRGRFKVCIADFNIDFGDVLNTLSYDAGRTCMTYWAADIQSQLDMGKRPEEIAYTEEQMTMYLQKNEKDGLYALIAPLTNEDSMDITETQIQIMLDNLIVNGGFDFVICDTGNNTRDSSIIALEKADEVLLVVTQDVNTANCNTSFLSTMRKVGFDLNKIRLVINKARPAKTVAISTEELEEAFVNANTGKPYPCIAKIKDNNEVKHANNLGEPLVYNSSHEFTRSMGVIAKEIIGDNFVLGTPEKKGFFKRLFGKK